MNRYGALERWRDWDAFLESTAETGFMQSSWWADFRVGAGYSYFGAVLKSAGKILGGALVHRYSYSQDSCFYYIPEGPVLPSGKTAAREVFAALFNEIEERRRADEQAVSHLRIEPRWISTPPFLKGFQSVEPLSDRFMEPRDTLCIDLRLSEEEILAQMKTKGRYNIRVAERHGVSVVEDSSKNGIADFLRIYEETATRQGIAAKPPDYFEELIPILSSTAHGSLFFSEYQHQRLAAAIVVRFGKRATYFFGGSSSEHRNVMAAYLLHFEIMRIMKAMGLEAYDLWGIAPNGALNHPWSDITTFKRKFGGAEMNLVPTMDYIYDAAAYETYLAQERELEVSLHKEG